MDHFPTPPANLVRRWLILSLALPTLLVGVALTIHAGLGVGSWQVFELGWSHTTGAGLAPIIVIESIVALAIAWAILRQPPGPATIVLAVVGGPWIQWTLTWLPPTSGLPTEVATLVLGCLLIGVAVGFYVPAELGPSAQDSLFVALYRRFDWRPGWVRFAIDVVLIAIGWWLGGPVGVGTIVVTVVVSAIADRALPVGHRVANTIPRGALAN